VIFILQEYTGRGGDGKEKKGAKSEKGKRNSGWYEMARLI
jgi:hypothetical protein